MALTLSNLASCAGQHITSFGHANTVRRASLPKYFPRAFGTLEAAGWNPRRDATSELAHPHHPRPLSRRAARAAGAMSRTWVLVLLAAASLSLIVVSATAGVDAGAGAHLDPPLDGKAERPLRRRGRLAARASSLAAAWGAYARSTRKLAEMSVPTAAHLDDVRASGKATARRWAAFFAEDCAAGVRECARRHASAWGNDFANAVTGGDKPGRRSRLWGRAKDFARECAAATPSDEVAAAARAAGRGVQTAWRASSAHARELAKQVPRVRLSSGVRRRVMRELRVLAAHVSAGARLGARSISSVMRDAVFVMTEMAALVSRDCVERSSGHRPPRDEWVLPHEAAFACLRFGAQATGRGVGRAWGAVGTTAAVISADVWERLPAGGFLSKFAVALVARSLGFAAEFPEFPEFSKRWAAVAVCGVVAIGAFLWFCVEREGEEEDEEEEDEDGEEEDVTADEGESESADEQDTDDPGVTDDEETLAPPVKRVRRRKASYVNERISVPVNVRYEND